MFLVFFSRVLTDADFKLHRRVHLTDHGGIEEGSMELVLPPTHELLQEENTCTFIDMVITKTFLFKRAFSI